MSAHDAAVKAAVVETFGEGEADCPHMKGIVSTSITAYLSHMRAAGYVVARVPDAKEKGDGYFENLCVRSWNACRAAMLESIGDKP